MRRLPIPEAQRKYKMSSGVAPLSLGMPTRGSADSLAMQPSTSSGSVQDGSASASAATGATQAHAHALAPGGLGHLHKGHLVMDVLQRVKEKKGEDDWDGDFDDVSFSKLGHKRDDSSASEDPDQKTLKPASHSPVHSRHALGVAAGDGAGRGQQGMAPNRPRTEQSNTRSIPPSPSIEDYSDLGVGETAFGLEHKLANLKLKSKSRKGIMHPDDLKRLKTLTADSPSAPNTAPMALPLPNQESPTPLSSAPVPTLKPKPARNNSSPIVPSPSMGSVALVGGAVRAGSARRHVSPSLAPPVSPRHTPQRSPPSSRQNSLRGKGMSEVQAQVETELQKYQEDEDDWDVAFEREGGSLMTKATSSLQLTRRSYRSWRSAGEEDMDPFAGLDDDFDMSEDIEANLLRDKKATLCSAVGGLVERIQSDREGLARACAELVDLFDQAPEMGLEKHFVASHGMLAVLEVLETRLARDVVVRLLRIVNHIVSGDVDMLESFCLVGGIPVIIPYTSKKHSLDTRLEASLFISHLTRSPLTLQMFISCRGLRILVELLDEDYIAHRALILSALEGIGSVFDLQSPTPRNDFARMFVREGILDPLSTSLLCILRDEELGRPASAISAVPSSTGVGSASEITNGGGVGSGRDGEEEEHAQRAVAVLLLFCQVAQADQRVRSAFASRTIVIRILKACDLLSRKLLVVAVKAIKHLSTSPQLIEVLQNSNAVEMLVGLLGRTMKGAHGNEICSNIFQTIFSMCRLSKARQEEAAASGIIPLLKRVITQKSPLKQFALPILCDLANAGKGSRRLLWHNDGLKLYLDLLVDPYWRVSALDAILAWMQDETARVEDVLVEKTPADRIVQCFVQSSGVSFEGILDPLLKILRLSSAVTASISTPALFRRLAESLDKSGKAVTKLNLLRITRVVCEHHPDRQTLVERFGLASAVERLAKQGEAVLVRELAKEVIPILLFGNVHTAPKDEYSDVRRIGLGAPSGLGLGTMGGGGGVGAGLGAQGSPQVPAQVRMTSMKRTASEGMVESQREREWTLSKEDGEDRVVSAGETKRAPGPGEGAGAGTGIGDGVPRRSSASTEMSGQAQASGKGSWSGQRGYVPSGLGPSLASTKTDTGANAGISAPLVRSHTTAAGLSIRASSGEQTQRDAGSVSMAGASSRPSSTAASAPASASTSASLSGSRLSAQTHAHAASLSMAAAPRGPAPLAHSSSHAAMPSSGSMATVRAPSRGDRAAVGLGTRPGGGSGSSGSSASGSGGRVGLGMPSSFTSMGLSSLVDRSAGVGAGAGAGPSASRSSGTETAGSGSGSGSGQSATSSRSGPGHKRMISRSQLREVQWQTDENGRLKSVRGPNKTT